MIHGTLELWSIIVACSAGVILGMVCFSREPWKGSTHLKRAAKDGCKNHYRHYSCFYCGRFFEGFVTRYYKMHWIFQFTHTLFFSDIYYLVFYHLPYSPSKKISDSNKWRRYKKMNLIPGNIFIILIKRSFYLFCNIFFFCVSGHAQHAPAPDTVVITAHDDTSGETEQSGTGYEPSDILS